MAELRRRFARALWELADLEAADSARRSFRARAYREAVWSLDDLDPGLCQPHAEMLAVAGIGSGVVGLIDEFRRAGTIGRLEQLRQVLPAEAGAMRRLPRMSPSRLRRLKAELGVESLSDLSAALHLGAAEVVPGVGPATSALWLDRLHREVAVPGIPIPRAVGYGERLRRHLERHVPGSEPALTGAVADLEERVAVIDLEGEIERLAAFLAGSALVCEDPPEPGAPRFPTLGGVVVLHRRSPPSPRVGAAIHLRGDLHRHSDWSPDGHDSLGSIVEAALARGLEYVAITDHGVGLTFGGLGVDDLGRQRREIELLNRRHPDLLLLQGSELNVGRNGGVDYADDVLGRLDFRLAAVHSYFDLDEEAQTVRLLEVVSHPLIHAIGHLTGRRIGVRPPIRLDFDAVLEAAASAGTALEVNGHLDRLDLPLRHLRAAVRRGVLFVACSDAHRHREVSNLDHAVTLLRRAGADPEQVVNTWPRPRLEEWLAGGGNR